MPQPDTSRTMVKGADISWVTEMEAAGRKFYAATGIEQDLADNPLVAFALVPVHSDCLAIYHFL